MMNKNKEVTNWAKARKQKKITPNGTKMCHKNPQKNLFLQCEDEASKGGTVSNS